MKPIVHEPFNRAFRCLPVSPIYGNLKHFAQFYENESILIENLAQLVERNLRSNHAIVLIATSAHLQACMELLQKSEVDISQPFARQQIVLCDARKVLNSFMVDGQADVDLFRKNVGELLHSLQAKFGRIFAFGEMVNILWKEGNHQATIDLELYWNDLISNLPVTLFCGYDIRSFSAAECTSGFAAVCNCHSRIFPSGSVDSD